MTRAVLSLGALLLVAGCEGGAPPTQSQPPQVADLAPAGQAVRSSHVPSIDPHTMVDAEIIRVLGAPPHCSFRYTKSGKAVLAFVPGSAGVVKVNGRLVRLRAASAAAQGGVLGAEGMRLQVLPDPPDTGIPPGEKRPADLRFVLRDGLSVGYRGFFDCTAK